MKCTFCGWNMDNETKCPICGTEIKPEDVVKATEETKATQVEQVEPIKFDTPAESAFDTATIDPIPEESTRIADYNPADYGIIEPNAPEKEPEKNDERAFASIPLYDKPAADNEEDYYYYSQKKKSGKKNKKKKLIIILLCILIPLLILGIAAAIIIPIIREKSAPIEYGFWKDGHYTFADAGLQMYYSETYIRDAVTENRPHESPDTDCNAVIGTADDRTIMNINIVDLTYDGFFGIFIKEEEYLTKLCETMSQDNTFIALNLAQQGDVETVELCGEEYLRVRFVGTFDDNGEPRTVFENVYLRRIGRAIVFIDIASSESEEALNNLLAILTPYEAPAEN